MVEYLPSMWRALGKPAVWKEGEERRGRGHSGRWEEKRGGGGLTGGQDYNHAGLQTYNSST